MEEVKERFVYLIAESFHRPLTVEEVKELDECHLLIQKLIVKRKWQLGKLFNFAYMARITKDWDWLQEVGVQLAQLERG